MRRSFPWGALLGATLPGLLATCRYDSAGPRPGGPAYLAVQPIVSPAVDLAAFGLTPDTIRLIVTRSPADTLRALTVFFDPDSSQIRLAADVTLRAVVETLTVHLELRGGGFALFAGTRALEVRAGRPGPPQQIAVVYIGPGTNVAALTLAPLDSVLTFGDALRFRVSAKDSGGAPVTAFYVTWRSSDTTVLRVDAAGLARAPQARALVYVRARTPTGIVDSTPVTVIPVPTLLSLVSGAGQRGVVGLALALPFRVRVLAPDGLGVKGIPVRFRALASLGSAVADSVVVSDTAGYAQTVATLGTLAGPQGFEARALALPATSFSATALAGAVSSATSVVTTTATSVLSGAIATLTLHAKDAFGNDLTAGGRSVVFSVTGGTSTGTIGPTVDHGDGTYTAPFTGVLAGTAATIGATIDGAPVTSAPLPTIAVLAGAVAQVVVTPAAAALAALGQTQQFGAVAQDLNGNVVPGQAFTWTSDNPLVALVDTGGIVTAVANGSATITATAAGVTGSAALTVAQVVKSVVVSPAIASLAVGLTQQFTAVAQDANGNPVPGQTFTWVSSQPLLASVDLNGLTTALAIGTTVITATTGGVSGTATLSIL